MSGQKAPARQGIAIAGVVAVGLVLGAAILLVDRREGHHDDAASARTERSSDLHAEEASMPGNGLPRTVVARVAMTDSQLVQSGVELGTAGPATIGSTLTLLGEVRYNIDRTIQVVPRLSGLVESVAVSAGDRVRKGQVLAVLSSQTLADQRGDLLNARRRLSLARVTYARERMLWEQKISAEQDMQQALAAMQEAEVTVQGAQQKLASLGAPGGSDLTRFELRAPIEGVVTDKRISVGEVLKDDVVVFTVSDLSTVWIESAVPVQMLGALRTGQAARVKANAFDGYAEGSVGYISAQVGEQTRTAVARIVLANDSGIWRPGLPVTVDVTTNVQQVPVAIVSDAVQDVGDRKVVFSRHGNAFESRPIDLGRNDGRHVEVLRGLSAGERYAAKNSFLIKAEFGKSGSGNDH